MREYKILFFLLMFLPFVLGISALPFLPPQIPIHFDDSGMLDRFGSRFEALVIPSASVITGFISIYLAKGFLNSGIKGKIQASALYLTAICLFVVFNIMSFYYLRVYFLQIEDLNQMKIEITQLIFSVFGLLIIIAAFLLPRLSYRRIPGLRLGWSERKEAIWLETRGRLSLYLFLSGLAMLLICFYTRSILCLFLCLITFSVFFILFNLYYRKARKRFK